MVNEEYIYQEGEGILLKVNKSSRILEIINQQQDTNGNINER